MLSYLVLTVLPPICHLNVGGGAIAGISGRYYVNVRMKVGLVGCGNIGADICIALQRGAIPAEIVALTDVDTSRAKVLLRSFQLNATVCGLEQNAAKVDFLVECAHADAVAFGGWSIDLHPGDGVFSEKPGCNQWHAKGIYPIPYRCLYSRNITNLFLAGRIISASCTTLFRRAVSMRRVNSS